VLWRSKTLQTKGSFGGEVQSANEQLRSWRDSLAARTFIDDMTARLRLIFDHQLEHHPSTSSQTLDRQTQILSPPQCPRSNSQTLRSSEATSPSPSNSLLVLFFAVPPRHEQLLTDTQLDTMLDSPTRTSTSTTEPTAHHSKPLRNHLPSNLIALKLIEQTQDQALLAKLRRLPQMHPRQRRRVQTLQTGTHLPLPSQSSGTKMV
jgi:hypothetical protein